MRPLSLSLNNFTNHSDSFIDFTKLPSFSIIVGMENNNASISNATGKTNIFNAIDYCLFDSKFSKNKDRVIKNGTNKTEVEFVFEFNDAIYKINRYKTKTTQGVKLFVKKGDDWDNVSGRTTSQTNEKIVQLLNINEQTFANAFYLKQNDYKRRKVDALASATPEDRKDIIFDLLKLDIWDKFEKVAKKTRDELNISLVKCNSAIEHLGQPEIELKKLNTEMVIVEKNITKHLESVKTKQLEFDNLQTEITLLKESLPKDNTELQQTYSNMVKEISKKDKEIQYLEQEHTRLMKESTLETNAIESSKQALSKSEQKLETELKYFETLEKPNVNEISNILDSISKLEVEARNYAAQLKLLSKPIPKDEICKECGTTLDDVHRKELQDIKTKEVEKYKSLLDKATEELSVFKCNKKILDDKNIVYNDSLRKQELSRLEISSLNTKISKAILDSERYNKLLLSTDEDLKSKIAIYNEKVKEFNEIKKQIAQIDKASIDAQKLNIQNKEQSLRVLGLAVKTLNLEFAEFNKQKGAIGAKIEIQNNNQKELDELLVTKQELMYKHNVAKLGTSCFSSSGVPALIIQSALDSLQNETNKLLEQIKPGSKIQFVIAKEKDDGNKVDTLDIVFIVNGEELDFLDLSGGQQCLFVTAIKLATAQISRQRCKSDIKLLLLDETDQALDDSSIDGLYNVIKNLSKDINVLLITHNHSLKKRFDKAILVSNIDGSSTASVTSLNN